MRILLITLMLLTLGCSSKPKTDWGLLHKEGVEKSHVRLDKWIKAHAQKSNINKTCYEAWKGISCTLSADDFGPMDIDCYANGCKIQTCCGCKE